MATKKTYDLVTSKPVARFYYQGNHSHPIRRTVLIIEERENLIIGYEIRSGNTVRTVPEALDSIKSFRKDEIAKWGDYKRLRMSSKTFMKDPNESTLERSAIMTMFTEGA
jgi:hypothetical protein